MRADSAERLARAALSAVAEPNDAALWGAVRREGAPATWAAVRGGTSRLPAAPDYLARAERIEPDRLLHQGGLVGARYVVPGDLEWPSQLGDADLAGQPGHPPSVPPLGLWLRGPLDLRTTVLRSAAVVGSRAATAYGTRVSADLASGLADAGWAVVSGGAFGIDAAAHRGALVAGGATVCVVACGVDQVYPRAHGALFDRLVRDGLLVSELPLGSPPTKARFLDRNRVIAALSPGTVLVEAAFRSGALNTALWARRMGRRLLALPGAVTSPSSFGPHDLVRRGLATLVTGAGDVLTELGDLHQAFEQGALDLAVEQRQRSQHRRRDDGLDRPLRRTLDALSRSRWRTPAEVEDRAGLAGPAVANALRHLTAIGLVEERDGRYRASP
jgi:DNA processing protein